MASKFDIEAAFEKLSMDLNQEFCRARTSNLRWAGDSNEIYFRISSLEFNWFDRWLLPVAGGLFYFALKNAFLAILRHFTAALSQKGNIFPRGIKNRSTGIKTAFPSICLFF